MRTVVMLVGLSLLAHAEGLPSAPSTQMQQKEPEFKAPQLEIPKAPPKKAPSFWDKDFMAVTAMHWGAMVADYETLQYCLRTNPRCREGNPVFGSTPSRLRMYAIGGAIHTGVTWVSWDYRRKHPGDSKWVVAPIIVTGLHGVGVVVNLKVAKQR